MSTTVMARAVEIVPQCRNALLQAIALAGLHDNHTCDRKGGGIPWLVTFTKFTYMEKNSVYTVVCCSVVRACMRCGAQCTRLGEEIVRVSGQNSPVVKHALWKGLATSVGAEVSHET